MRIFRALGRRAPASLAPRRRGAGRAVGLAAGRARALVGWGLVLFVALAVPALAQVGDTTYRLPDAAKEERAREVGRELRCLVCQNQSIEDSDASLARDLRVLVRERIAAGDSNDQVIRFVHERYGDFVLLRPPFRLSTLLLWATPALALLLGGMLAWTILRRRAAAGGIGDTQLSPAEQARLAQLEGRDRP